MKIMLLLMIVLFVNCYLTDLEEYKYFEKHDDHISAYGLFQGSYNYDGEIVQAITIRFDFSINRDVLFEFFSGDDTLKSTSLIHFKNEPPKRYTPGTYDNGYYVQCDPTLCDSFFTLRVQAASDVDTLKQSFKIRKNFRVYCEKGGVDSLNVQMGFGNFVEFRPFVNVRNYLLSIYNPVAKQIYIVCKYSKKFNKPYVLIHDYYKKTTESAFDFINSAMIDSLPSSLSGITYNFFEQPIQGNTIDRGLFCDIWKARYFGGNNDPHIASPGTMYALIYNDIRQGVYTVSLFYVKKVVYTDSSSGYLDCVLYTLN